MADQHIEIRPITEDEWPSWERSAARAFGEHSDPVMQAFIRSITEIERILDAFQNGRVVGSAASHTFELTVPGARVPFPFVDIVTVQPTHRIRGPLIRMMRQQMEDFRERGEFVTGLTASESSIYSRYGRGIAVWGEDWSISREHTIMSCAPAPSGETRFVDPDEMRQIWPGVYDRVRRDRGSMFNISDG